MLQYLFSDLRFDFTINANLPLSSIAKLLVLSSLVLFFPNCRHLSEPTGPTHPIDTLAGRVRDAEGPISGAVVRVQTTSNFTTSNDSGGFVLTGLVADKPVAVSAWAPGYYIGGGREHLPGADDVEIVLQRHATEDNPDYAWLSPFAGAGEGGNCENCHSRPGNSASALPFDEWVNDAHAGTARNPRFLTMYLGQDVHGNRSPPTRYGYNRDYGTFPLPPRSQ